MENNNTRLKEVETVYREHSERKARKERTKKKTTVTIANVTPDDRDARRREPQLTRGWSCGFGAAEINHRLPQHRDPFLQASLVARCAASLQTVHEGRQQFLICRCRFTQQRLEAGLFRFR